MVVCCDMALSLYDIVSGRESVDQQNDSQHLK